MQETQNQARVQRFLHCQAVVHAVYGDMHVMRYAFCGGPLYCYSLLLKGPALGGAMAIKNAPNETAQAYWQLVSLELNESFSTRQPLSYIDYFSYYKWKFKDKLTKKPQIRNFVV